MKNKRGSNQYKAKTDWNEALDRAFIFFAFPIIAGYILKNLYSVSMFIKGLSVENIKHYAIALIAGYIAYRVIRFYILWSRV